MAKRIPKRIQKRKKHRKILALLIGTYLHFHKIATPISCRFRSGKIVNIQKSFPEAPFLAIFPEKTAFSGVAKL